MSQASFGCLAVNGACHGKKPEIMDRGKNMRIGKTPLTQYIPTSFVCVANVCMIFLRKTASLHCYLGLVVRFPSLWLAAVEKYGIFLKVLVLLSSSSNL